MEPETEDIDAMRRLSIFGALDPRTIRFLLERCERVRVEKGGRFFTQGETGDAVFLLRTGRVAIVRELDGERAVLAELEPGQCFGEVALVAISPRTATVEALQDSTALKLRTQTILELFQRDLEQFTILQMNLGREVARRLARADEALFEYARRCGETRDDAALKSRAADTLK